MGDDIKFCPKRSCKFYEKNPSGFCGGNFCAICGTLLVPQKPEEPPKVIEELLKVNEEHATQESYEAKCNFPIQSSTICQNQNTKTDTAIVMFITAILKKDYDKVKGNISLRFSRTKFGDFKLDHSIVLHPKKLHLESNDYVMLEETIKINASILSFIEKSGNSLFIPYKYYLNEDSENLYLPQDDSSRTLIIDYSNFSEFNTATKYDMIILPDGLTQKEYEIINPETRLEILFKLSILPMDRIVQIPFSEIGNSIRNVLFPLCYGYYSKKRFMREWNFYLLYDSEEDIHELSSKLLKNWLMRVISEELLPFYLKFFLVFLSFGKELVRPFSSGLFLDLLQKVDYDSMSALLSDESELNLFLKHQGDIIFSPLLLHTAMKYVAEHECEQLIKFLPLYHIILNSQAKYQVAFNNHAYEGNDFWGLPSDTEFQYNCDIEVAAIQNAVNNFCELDFLLPNSIILLMISNDTFPQLLELFPNHFLSFISVLHYRVKKWPCLIEQDYRLRETVFTTFLDVYDQTTTNEDDICRIIDVIFKILIEINGTNFFIKLEEAELILLVLAKLLSLFDEKYPFLSNEKFHLALQKINHLMPANTLFAILSVCLDPNVINIHHKSDFKEITKFCYVLSKIQFPKSYSFLYVVEEFFLTKLDKQLLATILETFLNMCVSFTEVETSHSIISKICHQLIFILNESDSETPEADYQLITEYLIKIPFERFNIIIEVLDSLLECLSIHIQTEPVECVLSTTWWPNFINYCQPEHFRSSGYEKAATIYQSVVDIVECLVIALQEQSIQIQDLETVRKYEVNFISLSESIFRANLKTIDLKVLEKSLHDAKKQHDLYLKYRGLMHDLKKLLNFTNSKITLTQIIIPEVLSVFLTSDFRKEIPSSLCHDTVILPNSDHKTILNNSTFVLMLKSLPYLLKSQFFMLTFANVYQDYFKDHPDDKNNLEIILDKVWYQSFTIVSRTVNELLSMDILLSKINAHFRIYQKDPDKIDLEICNLLLAIEVVYLTHCENEENKTESLTKIKYYFRLVEVQSIARNILRVKDAYSLQGEFKTFESVSELNLEEKKLESVTKDMLKIGGKLIECGELHLQILEQLLSSIHLFKWVSENLKNLSQLDNITDLALTRVNNSTFEVNRITCFKTVCRIFAPFIFELKNEINEDLFLRKLQTVYYNIRNSEQDRNTILEMSRESGKELHFCFWKQLKLTNTSIGGNTISQLKDIMSNGEFTLNLNARFTIVEDILSIHIQRNTESVVQNKVYSLRELKDMESEVVLIVTESHDDQVGTQIQKLFEVLMRLSEIVLKLYISGDSFFRKRHNNVPNLTYPCKSIELIEEDASFLESEYENWISNLERARDKHYFLNYFTSSQIITIQMGLDSYFKSENRKIEKQVIHLLTFIQESSRECDVESVFKSLDLGSLSTTQSNTRGFDSRTFPELTSSSSALHSERDSLLLSLSSLSGLDDAIGIMEQHETLKRTPYEFDFEEIDDTKSQLQVKYGKETKANLNSLDTLETIFEILSNKIAHQTKRSFSSTFEKGVPNIIFVPSSDIFRCLLSIYLVDVDFELPQTHEVLICSEETTLEKVDIFFRRSLNDPKFSNIFCIAFIEKLRYEIAYNSVTLLKKYLHTLSHPSKFQLVFLCTDEFKDSSYMATALDNYKRITPIIHSKEILKQFVFKKVSQYSNHVASEKPAWSVDPYKSFIRIVSSKSSGNGKSLIVQRQAEKLKRNSLFSDTSSLYTTISIHDCERYEDKAVQSFIKSQEKKSNEGQIYHFDIISVSDKELLPFLFELLVMRTLCDYSGNVWRCSKNNYYMIEINLNSRSPELIEFLYLFPTWDCLGPKEVASDEKKNDTTLIGHQITQSDHVELESDIYKRVYSYIIKLKSVKEMDKFQFNLLQYNSDLSLDVLLDYSGLYNPSWSELNHFIYFFNNQLVACENNVYFNSVESDKSWGGFKKFLIDCLILMSRDFTTPSLRYSLQPTTPLHNLAGYSIEKYRRWEKKKNPYIFFNEDMQSMTFFGITISKTLNQLDSFDSNRLIEKKVISRQLYETLRKNQVDLDEDCKNWDKSKMIKVLANVLGIESPSDPDPYYVLTIDNLKKMLAIHMRFRSNIPVILMGETGCGKTRLIDFMCQLQAKSRAIENFIIFKMHGEINKGDIEVYYQRALKLAKENIGKNIDTILFFDEVNTSYSIGLIKEIICDRRIDGVRIPNDLRLQFVAACNPYRKHSDEMLKKLTSAGLGMFSMSNKTRELFGDIPLRELVYRVIPLPDSLLPLVWDFGRLDSESELSYIRKIVDTQLSRHKNTDLSEFNESISTVLHSAQYYMREREDECSFVSLRDVERTLKVMLWFHQLLPKLRLDTNLSLITYSFILSIAVCYSAKLNDRKAFDSFIIDKFDIPLDKITDASLIAWEIDSFQDVLVSLMTIGEHIAINKALKENLFMMFVCIQLKMPLFIIGKPGTSKSLAKSIISHSLNGNFNLNGKKLVEYTQVYIRSYQCSQLTTSKEIKCLFESCQTIQEESADDCVACVVLDEVGLAEDSPSLPLKILHPLLDDGINSHNTDKSPNVAFIGLSNWALDPAKMNRGIMLQLKDPSPIELKETALSIIKSSKEEENSSSYQLNTWVPCIAEGYLELIKKQQTELSKDHFGLRDFYHLIKMLDFLCKEYNTITQKIVHHAILRNFGGITEINVLQVFDRFLFNLECSESGPKSDILSLVKSNLRSNFYFPIENRVKENPERSRYLLILTENYAALDILFHLEILKEDTKVIFGSSFPLDQEYFEICHNINRIKVFMETGKMVVLTNLSNVYESLYELLNLFYVDILGKSWVDIGIGSQRIQCPVHPDFRLIVIADKNTVFDRFPPPLINRLEKHFLTFSTILEDDIIVQNIIDTLSNWANDFVTVEKNEGLYVHSRDRCFIGIQKDTLPHIVYSTINLFSLKRKENKCGAKILNYCKFELLKIASPNSILRLPKSQLADEATDIYKDYCSLKLFDFANYINALPSIRKHHSQSKPYLSHITTYSPLLTEIDLSEFSIVLTTFSNFQPITSHLNLIQFKSEQEFLSALMKAISNGENGTQKRIIIIQCENSHGNYDIISCAKYKVVEIIAEMNEKLNSNYYFVFIIRLFFTQEPLSYSSFCGGDWDSVYIDELQESYHYMLPPFDQLVNLSIAQVFDYQHYPLAESLRIDKYLFKKRRLLRCIHEAVCRLYDPYGVIVNRTTNRIHSIGLLLADSRFADSANFICKIIFHLLERSTSSEYSKEWPYLTALESDCSTNSTTFMKALSTHIDNLIAPMLSSILAIIDTNDNLSLASDKQYTQIVWKTIFQDEIILSWNSLITEHSLRAPRFVLDHLKKDLLPSNKFPFFKIIYQQVNRLFNEMKRNLGLKETIEIFEENFDQSPIGKLLSSVRKETGNKFSLEAEYLGDFIWVNMVESKNMGLQFKCLCLIISIVASNHIKPNKSSIDREKKAKYFPEYNIPSIHIAYSIVQERIEFVKDAFKLGFEFPSNHPILPKECLSSPNNYKQLQNIDFDIFQLLIDICWSDISEIQVVEDSTWFVEKVINYNYFIKEKWSFFRDFEERMSFLRSKWECIQFVSLFVTHFLTEKIQVFKATKLKKHSSTKLIHIFETALKEITKISPDEDIFRSPKSIQHILDIIQTMNEGIILLKKDKVCYSCGASTEICRCNVSLCEFFQDLAVHFFLHIVSITFATDTDIQAGLIEYFIKFISHNQTIKNEKHPVRKLCLFNSKEVVPSPSLCCIILQYLFRHSSYQIQIENQIVHHMEEIISKLGPLKHLHEDNLIFLVLQNLEDSYHHRCNLAENETQISDILLKLNDATLLIPFSSNAVTYELINAVAVKKLLVYWKVKWEVKYYIYGQYIKSQRPSSLKSPLHSPNIPSNVNNYFADLKRTNPNVPKTIQLFFMKSLYFHVGYGELLKYKDDMGMKYFYSQDINGDETKSTYLDVFYGLDSSYEEMMGHFLNKKNLKSAAHLKPKIGEKKFFRNILFFLFNQFLSKFMLQNPGVSTNESKKESLMKELINCLPRKPIDLHLLAINIQDNKLFNMAQLEISEKTHQNTIFIAGVLCHIGVLLQYTQNSKLLNPLTLIHYDPSALQKRCFPTIYEDCCFPTTCTYKSSVYNIPKRSQSTRLVKFGPHILGSPLLRSEIPTGVRTLSAISVALIRTLMHGIFIWTLHTNHFSSPAVIGELVEPIKNKTYSEYFYLHLIQDIIDVATVTNKTFEEAVLLVHLLFDLVIHEDLASKESQIPTELTTNEERQEWESFFENNYIVKLEEFIDVELGEKMKVVISKSNNRHKDLLLKLYEVGVNQDLHSLLWRYRHIVGYEHLSKVFNCQAESTSERYPMLKKFLKDKPVLASTIYLPDYLRLRMMLIQKKMEYDNEYKIAEMSIHQFMEFIKKDDSYKEFKNLFSILQIGWDELRANATNSGYKFPRKYISYEIDYQTTPVITLIGTSNKDHEGLLMSLMKVLVEIHNSFICTYFKALSVPSSPQRNITLSLISPSHTINYKHQLDNVIFSNATYSFRMGEGTHIHYDFKNIEDEIIQRFIFSKPTISFEEFDSEFPDQMRMIDYFHLLKSKIQQDELSDRDWSVIEEELPNLADISEVISMIEMVVKFAYVGEDHPDKRITSYLNGSLKYSKKKNLISNKANQVCCLKHLSALWHRLNIYRSKMFVYGGQTPFPSLSSVYLKNSHKSDIRELIGDLASTEIEGVLALLHDFIMMNLSAATDGAAHYTSSLRESLITFSKCEEVFFLYRKEFDCEKISKKFSVSHAASIWKELVLECKQNLFIL